MDKVWLVYTDEGIEDAYVDFEMAVTHVQCVMEDDKEKHCSIEQIHIVDSENEPPEDEYMEIFIVNADGAKIAYDDVSEAADHMKLFKGAKNISIDRVLLIDD